MGGFGGSRRFMVGWVVERVAWRVVKGLRMEVNVSRTTKQGGGGGEVRFDADSAV